MKTSLRGKQFLAAREAAVLKAYPDGKRKDGSPRWSIGFGSLATYGEGTVPVTVEMAWAMLSDKLKDYEGDVNRALGGTTVTQPMYDALVSLTYNTGAGNKGPLYALIKAGDVLGAADCFLTFNTNQGVVSAGHTRRRQQERDLFLRGRYGPLDHILVWTEADVKNTAPERHDMPQIE